MRYRILLGVVLSCLGCATAYQPSGLTGGFDETRLNDRTVQVRFRGNGATSVSRAQTFVLRRGAELTLESAPAGGSPRRRARRYGGSRQEEHEREETHAATATATHKGTRVRLPTGEDSGAAPFADHHRGPALEGLKVSLTSLAGRLSLGSSSPVPCPHSPRLARRGEPFQGGSRCLPLHRRFARRGEARK